MFTLTHEVLRHLLAINGFPTQQTGLVFWGLRGCLPCDLENYDFSPSHNLESRSLDYVNRRCTLVQWNPVEMILAVFPGSTVPEKAHIKAAQNGGPKCNQMMTGFYNDYIKGTHSGGKPENEHEAFRQTKRHPYRRTFDDLDYDQDDPIDVDNTVDNIHAAWCRKEGTRYNSSGCQVVTGIPQCSRFTESTEPWKTFHDNAYIGFPQQNYFTYVLLEAAEVGSVCAEATRPRQMRLRFGSYGDKVAELQDCLKQNGYDCGATDADFGGITLKAVLRFQKTTFDRPEEDCIVGPETAAALGMSLPIIG